MSATENKEIVRRYWEARFNTGQDYSSVLDQYVAPDAIGAEPELQKPWLDDLHESWKDLHTTVDYIIAEDDMVAVHATSTGTLTKEFNGFSPTDGPVTTHSMALCWLKDGKIVRDDVWYGDNFEVMTRAESR